MEHTDFIVLNMMKHQLLDIYQTYHEMPHLLADRTVKEAYQSLLSVKTLDDFKQWRKLVAILGLSFTDTDSVKRHDNKIGWLDDNADGESDATLWALVKWKNTFLADDWYEKIVENENNVNMVLGEVARDYDVHIVIFNCGDHSAVIGNDADRLFEIFGWQTGSVFDGEKDVSFMHITDAGQMVLERSGYSFKYLFFKGLDIMTTSFDEDAVAVYQQQMDAMRYLSGAAAKTHSILGYSVQYVVPKPACKEIANAHVFFEHVANGDFYNIKAKLEDGKIVTIADGNSWRLDALGRYALLSLGAETDKT